MIAVVQTLLSFAQPQICGGVYVVLYEAQNKERQSSAFLYMTVEGKSEKELEIAKRIFQSIRFDVYRPLVIEH